ncbi:conserved hypothetical protein [Ricinus communis]|uniref:Uncharacterized protein n=1 Tax=Ricinus communis TaxID=3988 RepID=B9SZG4_RICCO|nr:conserved hypothetical protein [Ricinus communis]
MEDDDYEDDEQEEYICVVRKLMLSPKCDDDKLFHIRCIVQGSLCDLIIDNRS